MIEIHNIQKVINGKTIVDITELTVRSGEIVALVGPSGSGKEILFDLLTGRTRPTAGRLRIANLDPAQDKEGLSQQVGVVFMDDTVYRNLSPRDNLLFFARLYDLPTERLSEVLTQVGLVDHAGTAIKKLSTGLLRRLSFGRAILHKPKVLLLFEPFTRCDEATITLLGNMVRTLADDGTTILALSSDQTHLAPLCDALYVINEGRIADAKQAQDTARSNQPFKIPVRTEDKVVLLNPADILYADASQGRAFLVTLDGRLQTQYTLSELENRLGRSGFFRAHRSYLVNLQHVKEVIPFTRNSFSLRLDDAGGTEIPLSKLAASELKGLLGY